MVDVKALIQKQREQLDTPVRGELDVVLGGEKVTLGFEKVRPEEWDDLVSKNPPRAGVEGDQNVGYFQNGLSRAYPRVVLDGEELDAKTWGEVFDVLDAVSRNAIGTSLWGMNVMAALKQLTELGKGSAGEK